MRAAIVMIVVVGCAPIVEHPPGHVTGEPTTATHEAPPRIVVHRCVVHAPPVKPDVDFLPEGCPPRFGGCLTGPDAAVLATYLTATRKWMDDTFRKCADGR